MNEITFLPTTMYAFIFGLDNAEVRVSVMTDEYRRIVEWRKHMFSSTNPQVVEM